MTQEEPKREWDQHLAAINLTLRAQIDRGTGFSHVTLPFGEPASLQEQPEGFFWLNIIDRPFSEPIVPLMRWREEAKET